MTDPDAVLPCDVAVIGGGPAGLMAAEVLSAAGVAVHLFDAMPSVGRKFLLAGRGGLNLTHSEPLPGFATRYGARQHAIAPWLADFGPDALRAWAAGLGVETFVGTSGRVFPREMKAAPLLRAWLQRLRHPAAGGVPVRFHMRHRWVGWARDGGAPDTPDSIAVDEISTRDSGIFCFESPTGRQRVAPRAAVLALGGASWPRLGSDAAWVPLLQARGVAVAPIRPANCGFDVAPTPARRAHPDDHAAGGWSAHFRERFAGQPLKSVALRVPGAEPAFARQGEFVVTATGVEGSLIYAASALLRDALAAEGRAHVELDLLPARTPAQVLAAVAAPRGSRSLASELQRRLGLDGVKRALLHEWLPREALQDPAWLAEAIKALPIHLAAPRPVEEAISSAGGVPFEALDEHLQLRAAPGVFCAGEMLDWEAPTGGYLLTACMASGARAGRGASKSLGPR